MLCPPLWLHMINLKVGGTAFGHPKLSASQAGLLSMLAQGIVPGDPMST